MAATYRFSSVWHVDAPPSTVLDALADVGGYSSWWPSVVDASALPGEAAGGRSGRIVMRGFLPTRIRITLTELEAAPGMLSAAIDGDLVGDCSWRVDAAGLAGELPERSRVTFEQRVEVRSTLLRLATPLLRPVLAANHEHTMRLGEAGLRTHLSAGSP